MSSVGPLRNLIVTMIGQRLILVAYLTMLTIIVTSNYRKGYPYEKIYQETTNPRQKNT